jgi:hypothetical protein
MSTLTIIATINPVTNPMMLLTTAIRLPSRTLFRPLSLVEKHTFGNVRNGSKADIRSPASKYHFDALRRT